ncbi:Crp/Fnr family transcriptional regulator [Chryseobacterium formosus]|uniref:Crp/Fnr family transcriptional regulator n=1 Tax=Chryseobacterium formosus TaxID=1537363 RepID=A0ABT3XM77_9FLAO|nr:Crp/Fnr family transcriptional regulator [Chryseobacterium formosus]MCX8523233.1 Crp/Fnr family transcriptional regulator [Chryseobacterium formosus]
MLRTNHTFLDFITKLYLQQERKEDVILKQFSKGQKLLIQNNNSSKVMFMKEGIAKCYFSEENDKEFILEFLGEGEIIGEIECIRNIPCLCNIEAMTDVSVYALSIPYFQSLLKNNLELNALLVDAFAERIVNTSSRASFQQLYTVEHSLRKLLDLQFKQDIHLSKEDLAAYLGISVRSLNRSLKNLNG